ncbi:hypothetical protein GTQ34_11710 [Muricauda sp. JGD-17]|uniref:Uncharacterized protein n=1 Tax=Flagellimonas ochracea TaxID=2696472 RepID=A0A964TCX6_9FLAO|nr:hypothetical protein [Allomuricauda ochracea]NAY92584.1 hypothetical protein [Allomuricauda ochracea]
MKNIATLLSIFLMAGFYGYSQSSNSGKMKTTIHKTFSVDKNGTEFPYNVKILETKNYTMAWDEKDRGQIDQDRKPTPTQVTKLIAVDTDNDKEYEHFLVLKYKKSVAGNFQVVPTAKGFDVKVEDRTFKYHLNNGKYIINSDDQDFFTVEEFKDIG